MHINHRRRYTLIVVAVVSALGLAAAVEASIPDGAGAIHGCYNASGGLRVIDTGKGASCQTSEKAVTWNVQGPAGPQGPQGQQGPQGAKGDQGDPGPTYSAGTGLGLSGTTFGIEGSYQLPQGCSNGQSPFLLGTPLSHPWSCFTAANADESCASGKFQTGVDASGDITCAPATADSSLPDVWITTSGAHDTPDHIQTTIATLSLPAGSYLLQANGVARGDDVTDEVYLSCDFGGNNSDPVDGVTTASDNNQDGFSLGDVVVLAVARDVPLRCVSFNAHTHVDDVVMTALAVGTVHS